jgi:hypothetical protein
MISGQARRGLSEMGYVFQFPELEPALRDILKK